MVAYAIFIRDSLRDPEELGLYAQKARAARGEHQLKPLAYYGKAETWEGQPTDGVVVLEFPDMDAARAWYNDPVYQAAKVHRDKAADYRVVLVEGL